MFKFQLSNNWESSVKNILVDL